MPDHRSGARLRIKKSGSTATTNADAILDHVAKQGLSVEWILDTHPQADHFSAARYLKDRTGAPTAIGEAVKSVQQIWKTDLQLADFVCDGSQWDRLFRDGDMFELGISKPAYCTAWGIRWRRSAISSAMRPSFTTRCSCLTAGPPARIFPRQRREPVELDRGHSCPSGRDPPLTGHDYRPGGREALWESTVANRKPIIRMSPEKHWADFVNLREARDRTLPIAQADSACPAGQYSRGELPVAEDNGRRYLRYR